MAGVVVLGEEEESISLVSGLVRMFMANLVRPLKVTSRTLERLFHYDPWLLVVVGSSDTFQRIVDQVRFDPRLAAVPILLLTDSPDEQVRKAMVHSQTIAGVLYKPFELDELAARVGKLCQPPSALAVPAAPLVRAA